MCLKHFFGTVYALLAFFSQVWSHETEPLKQISSKDLYVALGSSVELPCANTVNRSEWRRNGSMVVSGPVLNLHNTTLKDEGVYTCHGPDGNLIELLHLKLGYAPSPPDVQCWSPSYPVKALCSWTLTPEPILPTYYIATYWFAGDEQRPAVRPCQRDHDRRCVLEGLELFSEVPYLINITAVNALGSATHILPIILEQIVKPDPPVNVKAIALSSKKVHVQWAAPPTWPDPVNFGLKYKVHFYWGKPSSANIMGPYESNSMVRSGLVAGRTYHIRVSAMDILDSGQSSEWSDPVNITLANS